MPMATVREIELSDELSTADLGDITQDVKRMIRRARATKRSTMFVKKSLERFTNLLGENLDDPASPELGTLVEFIQNNRENVLDSVNPFISFFYTDGLLPGEVSKNALLIYILQRADELGYLSIQ